MTNLVKENHFLLQLPKIPFLFAMGLIELLLSMPITVLVLVNDAGSMLENPVFSEGHSPWLIALEVILIAPFLETLLLQYGIIRLGRILFKKLPKYSWWFAIVSSFAFASTHPFSGYYLVFTFLAGWVLVFTYYLSEEKGYQPFLMVFYLHAGLNLVSLIAMGFFTPEF